MHERHARMCELSEFARVFGIDFFSVLSRGSQYRVESMMIRLAKTENFVAFSPSKRQVESQMAPEAIPLVMEPTSRFHASPVAVLDFQSLYPSIMIAYNYWYALRVGTRWRCSSSVLRPRLCHFTVSAPRWVASMPRSPKGTPKNLVLARSTCRLNCCSGWSTPTASSVRLRLAARGRALALAQA